MPLKTSRTASDAATIAEPETVRLSADGQRALADAIITAPAVSAGLRKAFESHRRLIREVR